MTTTIWTLAIDAPNVGTEAHVFRSKSDLDDYIWENCIDYYETTIMALQEKYNDDHEAAARDDLIIEGVTYDYDSHEVPVDGRAMEFVHTMAKFSTPDDDFAKQTDSKYVSTEELVADLSDDRLCGDHHDFVNMISVARAIIKGDEHGRKKIYTAFCIEPCDRGTVWIDSVEADNPQDATRAAAIKCADDWKCDPEDVHVMGIAVGNVEIAIWEDLS